MGWWKESIDIVKKNDPAARTSLEGLLVSKPWPLIVSHIFSGATIVDS